MEHPALALLNQASDLLTDIQIHLELPTVQHLELALDAADQIQQKITAAAALIQTDPRLKD